jgi:hypothetical protein
LFTLTVRCQRCDLVITRPQDQAAAGSELHALGQHRDRSLISADQIRAAA